MNERSQHSRFDGIMVSHLRSLSMPHRLSTQARTRRANDRAVIENPLSRCRLWKGGSLWGNVIALTKSQSTLY